MTIAKITDAERKNVRVEGLNDVPGLDTRAMQQRFDGLGNLAIDKLNEVIDGVNSLSKASTIVTTITNDKGEALDVNTVLRNITTSITEFTNLINQKIVSVTEIPDEPQEGTVYLIQGKVAVK